jgi:hypothetical protein
MRHLVLNLLTVASVLAPLVIVALEGQSPLHILGTRIWIHYHWDINLDIPDGSGTRTIVWLPGYLVLLGLLLFPCLWLRRRWRQVKDRRTLLTALLFALGMMCLPLVVTFHGLDDVEGRAYVAIESFLWLCILAAVLWIPVRAIIYLSTHQQRRRRYRLNHGHCVQCDYNLTGNVSGICPECGCASPIAP